MATWFSNKTMQSIFKFWANDAKIILTDSSDFSHYLCLVSLGQTQNSYTLDPLLILQERPVWCKLGDFASQSVGKFLSIHEFGNLSSER